MLLGEGMGRNTHTASLTSLEILSSKPRNPRYSTGYFSKPARVKGSLSPEPDTNVNDEIPPVPPLPEEIFIGKHSFRPLGDKQKINNRMSMNIPSATTTRNINSRKSIGIDLRHNADGKYPEFAIDGPTHSPATPTQPSSSTAPSHQVDFYSAAHKLPRPLPEIQTNLQSPRSYSSRQKSSTQPNSPNESSAPKPENPPSIKTVTARKSTGSFHAFSYVNENGGSYPNSPTMAAGTNSSVFFGKNPFSELILIDEPSPPMMHVSNRSRKGSNGGPLPDTPKSANTFSSSGKNPFNDLILEDSPNLPFASVSNRPRTNSTPSAISHVPFAPSTQTRKNSFSSVVSASTPTALNSPTSVESTRSPRSRKSSLGAATSTEASSSLVPSGLRKSSVGSTLTSETPSHAFAARSRISSSSLMNADNFVIPAMPSARSRNSSSSLVAVDNSAVPPLPTAGSRNSTSSLKNSEKTGHSSTSLSSSLSNSGPSRSDSPVAVPAVVGSQNSSRSVRSDTRTIPAIPTLGSRNSGISLTSNDEASNSAIPSKSRLSSSSTIVFDTPAVPTLPPSLSSTSDFSASPVEKQSLPPSQFIARTATTPASTSFTPAEVSDASPKRNNLSSLAKSPHRPLNRPAHVYPRSNKKSGTMEEDNADKASSSAKMRSKSTVAKQWNTLSTSISSSSAKRLLLSPFSSEFRRTSDKTQSSLNGKFDAIGRRTAPKGNDSNLPVGPNSQEDVSEEQAEIRSIMKNLVRTMPGEESTVRRYEEYKKSGVIKDSMTPSLAAKTQRLNIYERGEILDYRNVYFCGRPDIKKISGDIRHASNNYGFDDANGDYQVIFGDHIAYRYEILSVLGKGSFGKVLKCIDHKSGKLVAVKLIINRKRFHMQALVEADILRTLSQWVSFQILCFKQPTNTL